MQVPGRGGAKRSLQLTSLDYEGLCTPPLLCVVLAFPAPGSVAGRTRTDRQLFPADRPLQVHTFQGVSRYPPPPPGPCLLSLLRGVSLAQTWRGFPTHPFCARAVLARERSRPWFRINSVHPFPCAREPSSVWLPPLSSVVPLITAVSCPLAA